MTNKNVGGQDVALGALTRFARTQSEAATPVNGLAATVARRVIRPGIVVIGASTGGPQALIALTTKLATAIPLVPICVTLHMPRDLMPIVASHVARQCGVEARVIGEPTLLRSGLIHFAPGDRHFDFHRKIDGGVEISLLPAVPGNYCKPAIDRMFAGAAKAFGARAVGIVLSGMGEDGLAGAQAIAAAGGIVLVQDKSTSAVWGMPGAVVKAGLAALALPPDGLAFEVLRRLRASGALA